MNKIVESKFSASGRVIYADGFDGTLTPTFWERIKGLFKRSLACEAGMATVYGDELTIWRANRRIKANLFGGKVRARVWNVASLPAGNIADVIVCTKLRQRDRVLLGNETHSALSSGAGTATASYGTYAVLADGKSLGAVADVDRFLAAASFEAAGSTLLANTQALFHVEEQASDLFLCCTNSVEAFATAGVISGMMLVVND